LEDKWEGKKSDGRIMGIVGDLKGILNPYGDEQVSILAKSR